MSGCLPLPDPEKGVSGEECLRALRARYEALRQGGSPGRPAVSIVIPVHFKETRHTFLVAMASLLDEGDCPPTEIIVVVNGKAATSELTACSVHSLAEAIGVHVITISYTEIEKYRDIDRPRHIFVPKQMGFEAAGGDIVIGVDIDCGVAGDWIKSYAEFFDAHPDVVAAYGPVHLHGRVTRVDTAITTVSTLVKAAKILIDFPPFAGHNHAIRKVVCERVPDLYNLIEEDCQEIPGILRRKLAPERKLTDLVRCVAKAVSSTDFSNQSTSWKEAAEWFVECARRNLRNLRRVKAALL